MGFHYLSCNIDDSYCGSFLQWFQKEQVLNRIGVDLQSLDSGRESRHGSGDFRCLQDFCGEDPKLAWLQGDQLMDIADAGEIMPPKSTWFEPKLRSGLFIYTLD